MRVVLLIAVLGGLVALALWASGRDREPHASDGAVEWSEPGDARPIAPSPKPSAEAGVADGGGNDEDSPFGRIDDAADCEDVCGAACVQGARGLECPPPCNSDADCAEATACVLTRPDRDATRTFRCLSSECKAPGPGQGCPEQHECITAGTTRTVFRCQPQGQRAVGEACASVDYAEVGQCAPGARCLNGRCYPTACAEPGDCPRGSVCSGRPGEPKGCMPYCASAEDCAKGHRCVETPIGMALCVEDAAPKTCLEAGCATGQRCIPDHLAPWDLRARCARTCEPGGSACPDGQVCVEELGVGRLVARHRCAPGCDEAKPCPAGFKCSGDAPGTGACRYDVEAAVDAYFRMTYEKSTPTRVP